MKRFRFYNLALFAAVLVAAIGFVVFRNTPARWANPFPKAAALNDHTRSFRGEELELIEQIRATSSTEERSRLISQLERLPVSIYQFHDRWLRINDIDPLNCWTDDGYHPSRSDCPRDIQLLEATSYGKADIDNGGFHQFFSNGTGVVAPEMIEWFERAGLTETASIVKEATAVFGKVFPRSQKLRRKFLASFHGETRADWDPFLKLDARFYASLPYNKEVFDAAADRWLREVCGIKNLHDTLERKTRD